MKRSNNVRIIFPFRSNDLFGFKARQAANQQTDITFLTNRRHKRRNLSIMTVTPFFELPTDCLSPCQDYIYMCEQSAHRKHPRHTQPLHEDASAAWTMSTYG